MVLSACSAAAPTSSVSPVERASSTVTTTTAPTTTTTVLVGSPGAPGIGDDLFPELGNGGYDVLHYELALVVDLASGALDATAVITATATQNLSSFNLDLVGLEVSVVEVDGSAAEFSHEGRELVVKPRSVIADGSEFETKVSYAGVPESLTSTVPFGNGWRTAPTVTYVVSQPDGAATWFPANDHPRDPATFTISIDPGPGYETVTSGVLVSDGKPDVWEIMEPTPPYLVALAIGEFERLDQEPFGAVPLVVWHPPGLGDALLRPFEAHGEMLEFFTGFLGPYPFDRYGALVIDDLDLGAALETQTLSTFGLPALAEDVAAHELVHQWFGNSVRLESWSDIWLNEGLATYGQWLWINETRGSAAFDAEIAGAYRLMSGVGLEGGAPEAALRFPPPAHPTATGLFNPSVYLRGGLAMVGLADEIGAEEMRELLGEWATRSAGSTVTTDDFVALVDEWAGPAAVSVLRAHLDDDLPPDLPERGLFGP